MPRRRLIASLAAVALSLAACGGGSHIPAGDAPRVVLQPGDVGKGYQRFDAGRVARADAQPGRADPTRFGRRGGWKARYRLRAPGGGPPLIESRVDVFADGDGASRDLTAYATRAGSGNAEGLRRAGGPRLGDESVAMELWAGVLRSATVAWRTANVTASVTLTGPGVRAADAAAFARRQQARLVLVRSAR